MDLFIGGVDFGEGPRWHNNALWYSDFYQRGIFRVTRDGQRQTVYSDLADRPSGLGWLPDGRLLVVSMTERKVLREEGGNLVEHADLSTLAPWHCNDMVVASNGNAYVGNFGFDFDKGEAARSTNLLLVKPNGEVSVAAEKLRFPNGSVITPDGKTLIVGQSYGGDYEAWTIEDDGQLSNRRLWANTPKMAPDGCTLDAKNGIWFADAIGSRIVRVLEGGEITHELKTPQPCFACTLGGKDGRTLYILTAPGTSEADCAGKAGGAIYTIAVDEPHAGLP